MLPELSFGDHIFDWSNRLQHTALLNGRDTRDFIAKMTDQIPFPIYGRYANSSLARHERIGTMLTLLEQRSKSSKTHWSQHEDIQMLLLPDLEWIDESPELANRLKHLLDHGAEHGLLVVIGRAIVVENYVIFSRRILKPIADKELVFFSKCGLQIFN